MIPSVDRIAQRMAFVEAKYEITKVFRLGEKTVLCIQLAETSHIQVHFDDDPTVMSKVWAVSQFIEDFSSQPLGSLFATGNAVFDEVIDEL